MISNKFTNSTTITQHPMEHPKSKRASTADVEYQRCSLLSMRIELIFKVNTSITVSNDAITDCNCSKSKKVLIQNVNVERVFVAYLCLPFSRLTYLHKRMWQTRFIRLKNLLIAAKTCCMDDW